MGRTALVLWSLHLSWTQVLFIELQDLMLTLLDSCFALVPFSYNPFISPFGIGIFSLCYCLLEVFVYLFIYIYFQKLTGKSLL